MPPSVAPHPPQTAMERMAALFLPGSGARSFRAEPSAVYSEEPTRSESVGGLRGAVSAIDHAEVFVIVTSLMVFSAIVLVLYCVYVLISPYFSGITTAVFLSVLLHRTHRTDPIPPLVEAMQRLHANWQWYGPWWGRWIGNLVLPVLVLDLVLVSGTKNCGLYKLPLMRHRLWLQRLVGCALVFWLGASLSSVATVLWVLLSLLALGMVIVWFLSYEHYARFLYRTCRFVILSTILFGVLYKLALEVVELAGAAKSSATSVQSSISQLDIIAIAQEKGMHWFVRDVLGANVTETATQMKDKLSPIIGNLSWNVSWHTQVVELYTAVSNFSNSDYHDAAGMVRDVALSAAQRTLQLSMMFIQIVLSTMSDALGVFYEMVLFYLLLQFLLKLKRTLLFYCTEKICTMIALPNASEKASLLEDDIVEQIDSLFLSFFHIASYHFLMTYGLFEAFSIHYSVLGGLAGVAFALFPYYGKTIHPFVPAIIALFVRGAYVRLVLLVAVLAALWSFGDAFLIAVGKRRHKHLAGPEVGVRDTEWSPFLIGTSIVLGMTTTGARGVVLGPLIVIVGKALWDALGNKEASAPGSAFVSGAESPMPISFNEITSTPSQRAPHFTGDSAGRTATLSVSESPLSAKRRKKNN